MQRDKVGDEAGEWIARDHVDVLHDYNDSPQPLLYKFTSAPISRRSVHQQRSVINHQHFPVHHVNPTRRFLHVSAFTTLHAIVVRERHHRSPGSVENTFNFRHVHPRQDFERITSANYSEKSRSDYESAVFNKVLAAEIVLVNAICP